jgi:biopolymer transport protein ExbD
MRLKTSSDAAKSKLVVTLVSHPDSSYYRTIDVLNSLAVAGISNVTFTSDSEQ